jgi:hypothetical protein
MPTFTALMQVVHHETWTVEADNEAEARDKIAMIHQDVDTDETGGEVVDWEVRSIKPAR